MAVTYEETFAPGWIDSNLQSFSDNSDSNSDIFISLDRFSELDKFSELDELNDIVLTPQVYTTFNQVKFGNISVSKYSLGNIIFRIDLILKRTNISYQFSPSEFKWECYMFSMGRYCKFQIKIFVDTRCEEHVYLIDINKTHDPSFIYRSFLTKFNKYFKSIESIPKLIKTVDCNLVTAITDNLEPIYKMSIDEMSGTRSKTDSLDSIDFLLEILEYSSLHQYAINSGIHYKLCYLLMELEYDLTPRYELVDTILYMCWLLSMGWSGRSALAKCSFLIEFLNKKIHQDLNPFEIYTLELAQLIMNNLEVIRSD